MFKNPLKRYPVSVAFSFLVAVVAIYLNHWVYAEDFWAEIVLTGVFGFFTTVAVDFFMKSKEVSLAKLFAGRVLALGFVAATYFLLFKGISEALGSPEITAILLFMTAVLGVFIGPFFVKDKYNGFWNHTVSLTGRILLSMLYFGVLFGGIAMLMASVDFLFSVNIDGEYYADVWFVMASVFAPLYVLGGMPEKFSALEKKKYYPTGVKFLAEYLLIPLVFAYFVVLYVYTGQIVFTWNWPNGDVANWIIVFSCVGILAYALSAKKEKFLPYVEPFRKWFFWALIPQIAVLFMAIGIRVGQYGFTEPRYFVVVAGLWFLFVSLYFLFSKVKDIKMLAFSLLAILIVGNFGPVSAMSVSQWSQLNRLEALLVNNEMLVEGKVVEKDGDELAQEDFDNITSAVKYLVNTHGPDVLVDWFDEDLSELGVYSRGKGGWYYGADTIIGLMLTGDRQSNDHTFRSSHRYVSNADYCGVMRDNSCVVDVSRYDFLLGVNFWGDEITYKDVNYSVDVDGSMIVILVDKEESVVDVAHLFDEFGESRSGSEMTFEVESSFMKGVFEIQNISFDAASNEITNFDARLKYNLK